MATERDVVFRIRVEGADDIAASFQKATKAATDAANVKIKESKRAADESAREAARAARAEEREMRRLADDAIRERKRIAAEADKAGREQERAAQRAARAEEREQRRIAADRAKAAKERERDERAAADAAIREQRRAADEAERNARRADHYHDQAAKKYMAGAQQAVASLTSLTRSVVLAFASTEEEAEAMLKTLARFEAGAQFFQGTIDSLQAMVTLWEAAEAASKAYALAEAASTGATAIRGASSAAAGATTAIASGAAGAAGGAVASGGVWGTLSGAMGWAASSAGAAASALAPFAAAVVAGTAAIGELIYRTTGNESFSVGGAFQGAMSWLGFGGERDRTPGQLAWAKQFEHERSFGFQQERASFGRDAAMRGLRSNSAFLSDNPLEELLSQRSGLLDRIISARLSSDPTGKGVGQNDAILQNRADWAREAATLEERIYHLRRMSAEESASAMQKQLQAAKAAYDAADQAYRSIQDRQRSTYERVANMNREEQMVLQSALLKDRAFAAGKRDTGMGLPEANMLRAFGMGDKSTEGLFRKEAESAVPALAEVFRAALDKAEMDRMKSGLEFDSLASKAAGSGLTVSGTVNGKMEVTVKPDLSDAQESTRRILDGLKAVMEQGINANNDALLKELNEMHARRK